MRGILFSLFHADIIHILPKIIKKRPHSTKINLQYMHVYIYNLYMKHFPVCCMLKKRLYAKSELQEL